MGAASTITKPAGSAWKSPSREREITPITPRVRPSHCSRRGHDPNRPDTSDAHTGVMAMAVAATPEPMPIDSAIETWPSPPTNRKVPTIAPLRHCRADGRDSPRARSHQYNSVPAVSMRIEVPNSGGMVSTMKAMARYVEPHTT